MWREEVREKRNLKADDQTKQKDEKDTRIYRLKDKSDGKKTDGDRGTWKGSLRRWGSSAQMKRSTFQGTTTCLETQERK